VSVLRIRIATSGCAVVTEEPIMAVRRRIQARRGTHRREQAALGASRRKVSFTVGRSFELMFVFFVILPFYQAEFANNPPALKSTYDALLF
jgi:hypothetical protein